MFDKPIEDIVQYTDRFGKSYVASHPHDLEPWFNDMIERYGLRVLTQMFPYMTLVLDKDTGMLKTWQPCNYNARVTNAFHLLLAQELDQNYSRDSQEEFALDLERFFPKTDIPEERTLEYDLNSVIEKDSDRYAIDYDGMSDNILIYMPHPGAHPNKDSYGNYRAPKSNIPNYNWNWYNRPQYNSYLPQYYTFNQYPF